MYVIEFLDSPRFYEAVRSGVDPDDLEWQRYKPGFESIERANNEALWLSVDDDGRYVYRVIPEPGAA